MRDERQWKNRNRHSWLTALVAVCAGIIIALIAPLFISSISSAPSPKSKNPEPKPQLSEQEPAAPAVPAADLQPALDAWLKTQTAQYSIEITDVFNHKVIAEHNPTTAFFTASLYKPFIAYFGYKKMTNGDFTDTPNYQNGRSRLQCLDLMIRNSDSPCGEKMMAELGRPWIDSQLPSLGMQCTSLVGLTTCAHDMNALILDFMTTKEIDQKYKLALFNSMDHQIFREAFEKGFTKAKFIGSKVGFNMQENYHETSLISFGDGRQYLITVMSQGQGSPVPLRTLGAELQDVLLQPQYAPSLALHPVFH